MPRYGARAHGAGCTLSAAIAARLALGDELPNAIGTAKDFVTRAITQSPALGRGARPLNHLALPADKS
jgi:hydroxymethylpyrimidine/phosphomethylpyrimidine kinase